VYAASKVAQEHLCAVWARETAASVVALRYHNVYGRRLPLGTPYAGVAALFRDRLRQGLAPLVFEDGAQTRDFVHVSDVAAANVAALAIGMTPGTGEAFNVASGTPVTILDVASALAVAFGPDAPAPLVTGRFRAGDVRHVVASPEAAGRRLGFRASTALAEGMADLAGEPLPAES
jgi:dTDP-L-rhamnose 4-epimerase